MMKDQNLAHQSNMNDADPDLLGFGFSRGLLSYSCGLAVALSMYWAGALHTSDGTNLALTPMSLLSTFFGVVLLSPFVETLIVFFFFRYVSKVLDERWAAYLSGAMFAAVHSIVFWAWGIIVLIPALIFSSPFADSSLPHKQRFRRAWLIHVVNNALVFLTMAMDSAFARSWSDSP